MDEVIEQCQVTFEEDGINNQTLDDLRKVGPYPVHSYFFMRLAPTRPCFIPCSCWLLFF